MTSPKPIFVFLGGRTAKYFELTVQSIKFVKKNVKVAIGVIVPPGGGELKSAVINRLKELDSTIDASDIKFYPAKKHFDNGGNAQYILDIKVFAKQYDPIVYLDSDTVVLRDIYPYVESFVKTKKKYALLPDFINDYPKFDENWETKNGFVPQTTFMIFKSPGLPALVDAWEANWKEWVAPAPFIKHKNPARYYKLSPLLIGQYSLGQVLGKSKTFDADINKINRSDLKFCRNLGIDAQKTKQSFLLAGSTFSKEGEGKITVVVKSGEVNEKQDLGKNVGDPFVNIKVGDWERKTKVVKNTQEPVWDEEFVYEDSTYADANNIQLTLLDWDAISSNDVIGTATLDLLPKKTNEADAPLKPYSLEVKDKKGKVTGQLEVEAKYYVELLPDEPEEEIPEQTQTRDFEAAAVAATAVPVEGKKTAVLRIGGGKVLNKHDPVGLDDPYLVATVGGVKKKTHADPGTQNPVWNEEFTWEDVSDQDAANVLLEVWDEDAITKDDLIGTATISLLPYTNSKKQITVPFKNKKTGKEEGSVTLDALLKVESKDEAPSADAEKQPVEAEANTTPQPKTREITPVAATPEPSAKKGAGASYDGEGKAVITIRSAQIHKKHDVMSKDDPFVELKVGQTEKRTTTKDNTQNPVWGETLIFDNVSSTDADNAFIVLYDDDPGKNEDVIGTANISLLQFLNKKQRVTVPVYQKGVEEAKIDIEGLLEVNEGSGADTEADSATSTPSAATSTPSTATSTPSAATSAPSAKKTVVQREFPPPSSESSDLPPSFVPAKPTTPTRAPPPTIGGVKSLGVFVDSANIYKTRGVGKDDPYVKVAIGAQTQQTGVVENSQQPVWDEELLFQNVSDADLGKVEVTLWDKDKFTKDDLIGSGIISLQLLRDAKKDFTVSIVDRKGAELATVKLSAWKIDIGQTTTKTSPAFVPLSQTKERGFPQPSSPQPPRSVSPQNTVRAVFKIISGLVNRSHDIVGKGDPYVIVKVNNVERKTTVKMNTKTPKWNEKLTLDNIGPLTQSTVATISMYDQDTGSKDDFIGSAEYPMYEAHLNKKRAEKNFQLKEKGKPEATLDFEVEIRG